MRSRLAEQESLTPTEAERVVELWAQRMQGTDGGARIEDIAEAISATPDQVRQLLEEVRTNAYHKEIEAERIRKRKRLNRVLIPLAILVWVVILGAAANAIYHQGLQNGRRINPYGWAPRAYGPGYTVIDGQMGDQWLPQGISVSVSEYQMNGSAVNQPEEEQVAAALEELVQRVSLPPHSLPYRSSPNLLDTLQTGGDKDIPGIVKFETISLGQPNAPAPQGHVDPTFKVPVALTSDPQAVSLIEAERARRLRIIANRILNMTKN